jgi:hypothetical protein
MKEMRYEGNKGNEGKELINGITERRNKKTRSGCGVSTCKRRT